MEEPVTKSEVHDLDADLVAVNPMVRASELRSTSSRPSAHERSARLSHRLSTQDTAAIAAALPPRASEAGGLLDVSPSGDARAANVAWWEPPRVVPREQQGHRACSTNDLVTDLIYVILLAALGRAFRAEGESGASGSDEAHPSDDVHHGDDHAGNGSENWPIAFRDFCAIFAPLWLQWNAVQSAVNR